MAIIVEEGERGTNIVGILGWVVFFGIVCATVYYVFFAQPQLVTISSGGTLSTIAPITQSAVHPDTVIQSPAFQALRSTVTLPSPQGPATVGRTDPFVAP